MVKHIAKKIVGWLVSSRLFAVPRRMIGKTISSGDGVVIFYNDPERSKVLDVVKKIKKENELLLGDNEGYQLFMAVKSTGKIEGEIAEVGSYRGGSSKIICEAKGTRPLHLFDTFEGLPALSPMDAADQFRKGQFSASVDDVKNYLKNYPSVHFYKGLFPATADPIKNKKFSFVHLDVDLYEATLSSIRFFYPRMNKGGVMLSHDYISAPGVRKAFDEFFEDKPEPIIEMSGSQCLIVKV